MIGKDSGQGECDRVGSQGFRVCLYVQRGINDQIIVIGGVFR